MDNQAAVAALSPSLRPRAQTIHDAAYTRVSWWAAWHVLFELAVVAAMGSTGASVAAAGAVLVACGCCGSTREAVHTYLALTVVAFAIGALDLLVVAQGVGPGAAATAADREAMQVAYTVASVVLALCLAVRLCVVLLCARVLPALRGHSTGVQAKGRAYSAAFVDGASNRARALSRSVSGRAAEPVVRLNQGGTAAARESSRPAAARQEQRLRESYSGWGVDDGGRAPDTGVVPGP